ncbi:ABC transporter ATP-binding protein [Velocimicrobium porci]|uniref:ABC transporter ATP-binding protein n=1 Tax=Velocimicrobium porci TaxID=2606634 RepID=A0A6L5XUN5_9FIRM|nr:ABC transporter ATP-binding protein [Velocimicrobium porci]MSS62516.1 ABC transporter ATP-binding protein [Velocimicrobium porci]
MIKILKFAKKQWYIMIAIILLLFIQANCELALPEYTSNIVDVGIQYGGIERPIPEVIREDSLNHLFLFMNEKERSLIENYYLKLEKNKLSQEEYKEYLSKYPDLKDETLYVLSYSKLGNSKNEKNKTLDKLSNTLVPAEILMTMLTSNEKEAIAMQKQIFQSMNLPYNKNADLFQIISQLPKEAIISIQDGIKEKMGDMSDMLGESIAITFVQNEYKTVGINLDEFQMNYLKTTGIKMLGLALLGMVIAILVGYLASKLAAKVSRDLRNKVFKKVISFSNKEINDFSTSSLITRCTNDIQQVQQVTVLLFRMVAYAPIMGIGGIIKVLKTNTSMAWIIAVAVGVILCLVIVLMSVAMPKFKKMQSLLDRLNLVSREILTGIPVIRAFSREKHEEQRFDTASKNLMKTQLFTNRAMALMMPTMMFVMNGITVLIIWVGANGIDLGELQVGDMMAFITYTMQIVMSFLMITMVSVMLPRAAVAANRIDEVLNSDIIIKDEEHPLSLPETIKGEIKFNHVHFRYPNADEDALSDISFTAKPGEVTAIIGSTGCGKSTLVQLIPRLYDVSEGSITLDGNDIRSISLSNLREKIGYVPQKGILFSGTIDSNLRFGAPNASKQQIEEAASIAQAEEFINTKPERYQTPIAQGGTNVSGGQKQRLAIARAIAKNPSIYIFDDSFSALDYKTDIALRKALNEKVSDATVLIVAQRISTIIHADKIIVLDEGKITGIGTHEELLKSNEIYQQIAISQLSQEELEKGKEAH